MPNYNFSSGMAPYSRGGGGPSYNTRASYTGTGDLSNVAAGVNSIIQNARNVESNEILKLRNSQQLNSLRFIDENRDAYYQMAQELDPYSDDFEEKVSSIDPRAFSIPGLPQILNNKTNARSKAISEQHKQETLDIADRNLTANAMKDSGATGVDRVAFAQIWDAKGRDDAMQFASGILERRAAVEREKEAFELQKSKQDLQKQMQKEASDKRKADSKAKSDRVENLRKRAEAARQRLQYLESQKLSAQKTNASGKGKVEYDDQAIRRARETYNKYFEAFNEAVDGKKSIDSKPSTSKASGGSNAMDAILSGGS
jgi:hypothetical protein